MMLWRSCYGVCAYWLGSGIFWPSVLSWSCTLIFARFVAWAPLGYICGNACKVWPINCWGRGLLNIDANLCKEGVNWVTGAGLLKLRLRTSLRLRMRPMVMGMIMRMTLRMITAGAIRGSGAALAAFRAVLARLLLTSEASSVSLLSVATSCRFIWFLGLGLSLGMLAWEFLAHMVRGGNVLLGSVGELACGVLDSTLLLDLLLGLHFDMGVLEVSKNRRFLIVKRVLLIIKHALEINLNCKA